MAEAIVAGVMIQDGRILLCHRSPDRWWYPDVWDLPGGHVEPGETPAAALRRDLEELGAWPGSSSSGARPGRVARWEALGSRFPTSRRPVRHPADRAVRRLNAFDSPP